MMLISLQERVIWQYFAFLAHSLDSICLQIGKMTRNRVFKFRVSEQAINYGLTRRWIYRRSIVADGNFHGDHMKMKYPENDVSLMSKGEGYVVEDTKYQSHLAESKESSQVSDHSLWKSLSIENLTENHLP